MAPETVIIIIATVIILGTLIVILQRRKAKAPADSTEIAADRKREQPTSSTVPRRPPAPPAAPMPSPEWEEAGAEPLLEDADIALQVDEFGTGMRGVPAESPTPKEARRRAEEEAPPVAAPTDHMYMEEESPEEPGIQFSAYYPRTVAPQAWQPLVAYIFKAFAADAVAADARQQIGPREDYLESHRPAMQDIPEGALITATPRMEGFQFNPPSASVYFYEDWHRFAFKLRATGAQRDASHVGFVTFTVEGVIVADVPMVITVSESVTETETASETADPYQAIFCSYSHRDTPIVERVEAAYKALGLEYLRDVTTLRSGQHWNEELMHMIEEADIFQLFWSENAAASKYVEQEWRHALALAQERAAFIRPVYWTQPMPPPPPELGHIHFAYQPELAAGS